MITKLILDDTPYYTNGKPTGELIKAGTPVKFIEFGPLGGKPAEIVCCELLDERRLLFDAATVESFHEPEESLSALAEATGVKYDTLARYAREGRILARKSGGVWLSTQTAVEFANIKSR